MTRELHVFRDPALDGPTNMARDEHLLYSEAYRPAAVRIYAWSPPTISLGCFQFYAQVAELPAEVRYLPVVRRPTGGGAILHDREVTYCLVVDDSLPIARQAPVELYRLVHGLWRDALSGNESRVELAPDHFPLPSPRGGPFFCFEKPARTDLIIGSDKLLGSAQRRIRGRVLQHGSLLLGRRFAAHPGADLGEPEPQRVAGWIEGFLERLAQGLSLEQRRGKWTPEQLADIEKRRRHYASDVWTRRR
ncbi:MAG: biotin/lipoate A/B protein ligase family protein [Phycisphaerae bacterium]